MKNLILGILALAIITATSCKKENDKPSNPNPNPGGTPTLQGTWKVSTILTVEEGADPYTYKGVEGDHYEFRNDGNVYVQVGEYQEVLPYEVVDDKHINIDGDIEEIKEFTEHKLVVYSPATEEQPESMTFALTK